VDGWFWSPCSLDVNPCNYVLWGYLEDHVYHTNLHSVPELQVEIETVAEEITGDMLCDTI